MAGFFFAVRHHETENPVLINYRDNDGFGTGHPSPPGA
jgi:hypothetical protein